jgi:hypothetical protein
MSVFSGLSRPLKAAGVALIGVAIIAAVVGGVSALSGGGTSNEAGPTTSTPPPSSPGGVKPPSTLPSTSAPSSTPPPASTTGTTTPPGQSTGNQQTSNKWVTVRVLNNSLIKGLADRAADDFRGSGWNVSDVGNYSQGVIETTTAYFRPGTDEEAAAKQLAQEFGIRVLPRFEGIKDASPGVIVIVTKEYQAGHKGS